MHPDAIAPYPDLLDGPAAAVLTTYRRSGAAVSSPVWFRATEDHLEVVIAEGDVKLVHLAARPECSLLVFEATAPFRGVRIEGSPQLRREGLAEARLAIATAYLGEEGGRRFAAARGAGMVLSLLLSDARVWDLTAILP